MLINFCLFFFIGQVLNCTFNKGYCVCFLCGYVDLLISSIRLAEEDILLDVLTKEYRLLHNVSTRFPQVEHIVAVQIFIVDEYLSLVDVVETKQNVDERALATTRVAYKSNLGTSRDFYIELLHDTLSACWVVERRVFENNLSMFDHFEVTMSWYAHIKRRRFVDDGKNRLSGL